KEADYSSNVEAGIGQAEFHLRIYSLEYKHFKMVSVYANFYAFLSELGGILGLWIGLCFLDFFEFGSVIGAWLIKTIRSFRPAKSVAAVQDAKPRTTVPGPRMR